MRARALRISAELGVLALITWICFRVVPVNAATAGFVYLVGILFFASRWGLWEAITASLVAVACYNFFFLPPVGTFTIADPQNLVALFAFLATSITASHFSNLAKKRAAEATRRQAEMEKLYALSRSILLIQPPESAPKQLAMHIAQSYGAAALALYIRETDEIHRAGPEDFSDPQAQLQQAASNGTMFRDEATHTVVTSIRLGAQPIASLGVRGVQFSDSALQGLANLVAIGLERARVQETTSKAEAARQSDELKSTLLDAIAHEFKTPLTSIKAASTSLLSTQSLAPDQQRDLLSVIDEETDHLSVLVTEAIQMARIEAGRVQLHRENWSMKELLDSVLDKLSPEARQRVQTGVKEDIPPLWIDRELIEVALRQLVDNALKYSPAQSPVSVSAALVDGRAVVSVADKGQGIPEDEQSRIFEKFYRGEASRHQIPGAGLGLVIAREIIHTHGGEMWVESKVGEGSVFHFSLPASPPHNN